MKMRFEQGSEWRRWDLHIHSPASCREAKFSGWDNYIAALEQADREIVAIGITDYASIEGYKKVLSYRENGRLSNFELIVPNIEFRLNVRTDRGSAINFHLIFSNQDPNHVRKIEDLLSDLKFSYKNENFPCTHQGLVDLGRAHRPDISNDREAYEIGNNQFKLDIEKFETALQKSEWIRQNCLFAIPNSSVDGASALQKFDGFEGFRERLYHLAHIIFSSNEADRDYFLGKGADSISDLTRKIRGLKPCLHGSDAHDEATLFKPKDSRYCWIKADPTFDGLRQVLYEPEERVHIGPVPPVQVDNSKVIRSIKIESPSQAFPSEEIHFNSGLVSIIGQKGTGKSALAELIAFGTGSWYPNDGQSFLERAGKDLKETSVSICWADDHSDVDRSILGKLVAENEPGSIRYLSQRFVEQLCSDDRTAVELTDEIESVIFSYLGPDETLDASNFSELRDKKTARFKGKRIQIAQDLAKHIGELISTRSRIESLSDKKQQLRILQDESERIEKNRPKSVGDESEKLERAISELSEKVEEIEANIAALRTKIVRLGDIESKILDFDQRMIRFYNELKGELLALGFEDDSVDVFRPAFPGDTQLPLQERVRTFQAEIDLLKGDDADPADGTLVKLQQDRLNLGEMREADKITRTKIERIETRLSEIRKERNRIDREIAAIEKTDSARIASLRSELTSSFLAHLETLRDEKLILEELYKPAVARLQSGDEQEKRLEFVVRWRVDINKWLERGNRLFDGRSKQPFDTFRDLEEYVRGKVLPAFESLERDVIIESLNHILAKYLDSSLDPTSYLRTSASLKDLLTWIFEVDHITLAYGLRFNGAELENLSPGTKGVVLLILYLGIDKHDTRPIIIDQPEENLDNRSVYSLLAAYFRSAKKYRQIFIITHNPNLVVGTDADQVIVADAERRDHGLPMFSYFSGSLENTSENPEGIRERVCSILEGGRDAFHKREQIYSLR